MNTQLYDVVIIGGGPAGMTAAIYCKRQNLDVLLVTKDIGGQMSESGLIENYPGFVSITGSQLTTLFEEQLKKLNVNILIDNVMNLSCKDNIFYIQCSTQMFKSKSIIICSGKQHKKLNIPGEIEYANRGVVYCAVCDGFFYKNKIIAIIGGGNSALDSAIYMTNIAKKIYIINKNSNMKGDKLLFEKLLSNKNVEFIYNSHTYLIEGDEKRLTSVFYKQNNKKKQLYVDGVFIHIGSFPNDKFVQNVNKNNYNEIVIDLNSKTNIEGLFCAGDISNVEEKQIAVAVGDGCKAALAAIKYLQYI